MTARMRLAVLVAGAMTVLAFATTVEDTAARRDLTAVDPDPVSVAAPAVGRDTPESYFYCAAYRPHGADRLYDGNNYWFAMSSGMVSARCLAYEGSFPNGITDLHYYHVTVNVDTGASWWTPLNPITW